MGALLDSLSGAGYDGSEEGGVGDVGDGNSPLNISNTSPAQGGGFMSGLFQTATALGSGYVARRMDIDLYTRAQGAMPYPGQTGTAPGILMGGKGVPGPGGTMQTPTLLNLSALMPFLLVGAVVFFVARKAG